ncbi:hypothetical protein B484DRAFT_154615 [Ochromonadaceae sp. CCMP2298]|nr:hypothetical protein B484DRAFT_154615 [Ochromonadaceae sp. CCMP2298]
MDPAAKSIGRLRALLFGAVTVTAVLNGLVVYYGLRNAQQFYAGMEFKSLSTQAGQDIRKSFAQSGEALTYLAERYATTFPNEEDWPLVQLPGFVRDIPYLQASSGFEALLFVPVVKWEDVKRTERFLMDAWAANPLIPYFAGRYPLPGLYGLNETAGGMPYKDTTKVSWPAQYEVVLPVAQMLMDHGIPADVLGQDLHATGDFGPVFEDIMRCTGASPYSYAREKCSAVTSVDYAVTIVDYVATSVRTVTSNIAIPIMLNQNSSQLVGFVGGYFQVSTLCCALRAWWLLSE